MTQITLKLFASLSDYLPPGTRTNQLDLNIGDEDTIQGILARHQVPERMVHPILINGVFIPLSARATRRLQPGDQLAVWPPVAGG
jgi:molybdopterin converting factor small subunit